MYLIDVKKLWKSARIVLFRSFSVSRTASSTLPDGPFGHAGRAVLADKTARSAIWNAFFVNIVYVPADLKILFQHFQALYFTAINNYKSGYQTHAYLLYSHKPMSTPQQPS